MAKGGFRKKVNLNLSPELFAKLSLRQQNEYLDRLAKRYNQRIKQFYKVDPYHALKIYEYNDVAVGKPVFTRKKAKTKEEAKERFAVMEKFANSRYSSITTYREKRKRAVEQLAENVGLSNNKMSNADKESLAGFFDYIYAELKINKREYNYLELTDFYSAYKLTEQEQNDRLEDIKEAWRKFKESDITLAEWVADQKTALRKSGLIAKGDTRPLSQILRERWEQEHKE